MSLLKLSVSKNEEEQILLIADFSTMGGTRTYFLQIISFLERQNKKFICYIPDNQADGAIRDILKTHKVPFYLKKNGFRVSLIKFVGRKEMIKNLLTFCLEARRLNKFMKANGCNKLLISTGYNDEYIYMFMLPYKVIYINHTLAYYNSHILNKHILNISFWVKKNIVGVSTCSIKSMIKFYQVEKENIPYCKILYNYSVLSFNNKREYKNKNNFTISTVGHVENYKNPMMWLEIAITISNLFPSHQLDFYWAGEGAMEEECKIIAKSYKNIHFLGVINTVEELMNQTDIYLQTSEIESFGLAALDAMANGIPVLLKNTTGLSELIENDKSGYLFDSIDEGVLKLSDMILNYPNLKSLAYAAKERQEYIYSLKQWEIGLNKLINEN